MPLKVQWTIYSNKVPQLTWINNLKTQNCHIHSIKHCIQILFIQTQTSRKLFLQWLLKNMLIAYIWECMRATFKSRLNTGCLRYIYFPQKSNAYKSYFSWKYIHCDISFANINWNRYIKTITMQNLWIWLRGIITPLKVIVGRI